VAAVKKAADTLIGNRYLLPEDAVRLASKAEREALTNAP